MDEELLRINSLIEYDKNTGLFTKTRDGKPPYTRVGNSGYLQLKVGERHFLAHRLAWYIHYGSMPKKEIDHIDGNKTNNAIANLREVSRSENIEYYLERNSPERKKFNALVEKHRQEIRRKKNANTSGSFLRTRPDV